ncbi:pilus assembly protein [Paraburkholderia sp. NMBU_R16]|uniref:type 4 pilus major pilin n=1 Tax=Paraburkholderia sp. NMBU_R16 TaxID=2698676 RepID=UPI00156512DA|nr:type 4 pilus major pilin [Paraburkholderia sp. NMBU_R16]NRO98855.1 pilus assembly protein [Paraburkholderia sp. NMBU_R16]
MTSEAPLASRATLRIRRSPIVAQRGASLLEAIAYLGIAAIVVIGAVALLSGAFSSAGTNALTEQVNAIQTGVKKLYMGQGSGYTGLTNAVVASAGIFPSSIPVNGGKATDSWGGDINVTGNGATFSIQYTNIPASVCINAITTGGSWASINVGTKTETTIPVDPSTAQQDCDGGNGSVDITWTSN